MSAISGGIDQFALFSRVKRSDTLYYFSVIHQSLYILAVRAEFLRGDILAQQHMHTLFKACATLAIQYVTFSIASRSLSKILIQGHAQVLKHVA